MFFSNIFHFVVTQTLIGVNFSDIEGAVESNKKTRNDNGFAKELLYLQLHFNIIL